MGHRESLIGPNYFLKMKQSHLGYDGSKRNIDPFRWNGKSTNNFEKKIEGPITPGSHIDPSLPISQLHSNKENNMNPLA